MNDSTLPDNCSCWVLTDGKIGMVKQCVALADAVGVRPVMREVAAPSPWRWLPAPLWPAGAAARSVVGEPLVPPWPDLLIATGRTSVAPALAIKQLSGGHSFCVQLQNPGVRRAAFDMVVAPRHDRLGGANVVETLGALHEVTSARLQAAAAAFATRVEHLPRPLVAVLLGGPNRVFRFTPQVADRLGDALAQLAREHGAGLLLTPSRRTPAPVIAALHARLQDAAAEFWDGEGENPYLGYLGLSDAVVVTEDSVNMVTEASGTGKPVLIAALEGGSRKFSQFHAVMRAAGICQPFTGSLPCYSYTPPNDTIRVANEVRRRLRLATV